MEKITFEAVLAFFAVFLFTYLVFTAISWKKFRKKFILYALPVHCLCIGLISISGRNLFGSKPILISASPSLSRFAGLPTKPVTFTFSTIVDFGKLKTYTYPDAIGTWKAHPYAPFIQFGRSITFMPHGYQSNSDTIMLYFARVLTR